MSRLSKLTRQAHVNARKKLSCSCSSSQQSQPDTQEDHNRVNASRSLLLTPSEYTETAKLLHDIQQRVENSQVLNGGFETMLYKIDKIEESQGTIVNNVNEINEAIYQPDHGIFSRIASLKSDVDGHNQILQTRLETIDSWLTQSEHDKIDEKREKDSLCEKIQSQQRTIESLERWKANVTSAAKWILTTVGASAVTITMKLLYDYVISRVH